MSGPWEKYQSNESAGPWSKYQASETPGVHPEPSVGEAIEQGIGQGASLGFKDRISGLIQAALGTKFGDMLVPEGGANPYSDQSFGENYRQGKQDSANEYARAMKAHPGATFAGSLVGGLPGAVIAGPSLAGSAGLGAIAGVGSTASDNPVDMAGGALSGATVGGIGYGVGKGLGAIRSALETATPAVNTAKLAARKLTGLADEAMPSSLDFPERPADWFMKVRGAPEQQYATKTLPPVNHSNFTEDLLKGSAAGGLIGKPHIAGPLYAISRLDVVKQSAQDALDTAAPALRAIDKTVQTGAEFVGPQGVISNLSPKLQQTITQAAQQGPRQLAITHFLLGNTNPEYQSSVTQQKK